MQELSTKLFISKPTVEGLQRLSHWGYGTVMSQPQSKFLWAACEPHWETWNRNGCETGIDKVTDEMAIEVLDSLHAMLLEDAVAGKQQWKS